MLDPSPITNRSVGSGAMSAIASHAVNAVVAATARRRAEFRLAAASRSAPSAHEKTDCKRDYCASDSAGLPVTRCLDEVVLNRTCCRAFQEYPKFRIFQECGCASSNAARVLLTA